MAALQYQTRYLGQLVGTAGHRFVLSSSVMGICPALQRMINEDRPGSMGRSGPQWNPRRGCVVRGENIDETWRETERMAGFYISGT